MTEPVRLHRLLARMGVASLRGGERLISEGRVAVNGRIVTAPGASAFPGDEITVDGQRVVAQPHFRYVRLNKPAGTISTARDELARRTVVDVVGAAERLFPVGRLDRDSEGLMLLTNDGALAERLTHPRYGFHKTYLAEVRGRFTPRHLERLRAGVELEDGPSRPIRARIVRSDSDASTVELTLGEGRNRQVRRTMEALGFDTLRLVRTAMGPLQLEGLKPGEFQELSEAEAKRLRTVAGLPGSASER